MLSPISWELKDSQVVDLYVDLAAHPREQVFRKQTNLSVHFSLDVPPSPLDSGCGGVKGEHREGNWVVTPILGVLQEGSELPQ